MRWSGYSWRVLDKYKVPKAEQGELLQIVGTTKRDIVVREVKARAVN